MTDAFRPVVLVVEDDPALQLMLSVMLEQNGHPALCADNREQGLGRLQEHPSLVVILLDMGLPPNPNQTYEGVAFLDAVSNVRPRSKVVVLSGQDQAAVAYQAIRSGAFDVLAKPASPPEILHAVRRALLYAEHEERFLEEDGLSSIALRASLNDGLKAVRDQAEERLIRQALQQTGFNVVQTARLLGIKRENVYYFLKKYGITRDD